MFEASIIVPSTETLLNLIQVALWHWRTRVEGLKGAEGHEADTLTSTTCSRAVLMSHKKYIINVGHQMRNVIKFAYCIFINTWIKVRREDVKFCTLCACLYSGDDGINILNCRFSLQPDEELWISLNACAGKKDNKHFLASVDTDWGACERLFFARREKGNEVTRFLHPAAASSSRRGHFFRAERQIVAAL